MSDHIILHISQGSMTYNLRYKDIRLFRHSMLFRRLILDRGHRTFTLADLTSYTHSQHDAEAFAQVIHWLAESCKAEPLNSVKKSVSLNEDQAWILSGQRFDGTPFSRAVPWLPIEVDEARIGKPHCITFKKGLWTYAYMVQLELDDLLKPKMLAFRAKLLEYLQENVPKVDEVVLFWKLLGIGGQDHELTNRVLTLFVEGVDMDGLGSEDSMKVENMLQEYDLIQFKKFE